MLQLPIYIDFLSGGVVIRNAPKFILIVHRLTKAFHRPPTEKNNFRNTNDTMSLSRFN